MYYRHHSSGIDLRASFRLYVPLPLPMISTAQILNSHRHQMPDVVQHPARHCHHVRLHTDLSSVTYQVRHFLRSSRPPQPQTSGRQARGGGFMEQSQKPTFSDTQTRELVQLFKPCKSGRYHLRQRSDVMISFIPLNDLNVIVLRICMPVIINLASSRFRQMRLPYQQIYAFSPFWKLPRNFRPEYLLSTMSSSLKK